MTVSKYLKILAYAVLASVSSVSTYAKKNADESREEKAVERVANQNAREQKRAEREAKKESKKTPTEGENKKKRRGENSRRTDVAV